MPKNILEAVFCSSNDEKQFLPIKFYHNCSMSGTRKSVFFVMCQNWWKQYLSQANRLILYQFCFSPILVEMAHPVFYFVSKIGMSKSTDSLPILAHETEEEVHCMWVTLSFAVSLLLQDLLLLQERVLLNLPSS